ncbi:MAG: hypothetical protein GY941_04415 [Planctomycetes bacterium]|nr:hypothetical protein [Planctomycetota bacterium]
MPSLYHEPETDLLYTVIAPHIYGIHWSDRTVEILNADAHLPQPRLWTFHHAVLYQQALHSFDFLHWRHQIFNVSSRQWSSQSIARAFAPETTMCAPIVDGTVVRLLAAHADECGVIDQCIYSPDNNSWSRVTSGGCLVTYMEAITKCTTLVNNNAIFLVNGTLDCLTGLDENWGLQNRVLRYSTSTLQLSAADQELSKEGGNSVLWRVQHELLTAGYIRTSISNSLAWPMAMTFTISSFVRMTFLHTFYHPISQPETNSALHSALDLENLIFE